MDGLLSKTPKSRLLSLSNIQLHKRKQLDEETFFYISDLEELLLAFINSDGSTDISYLKAQARTLLEDGR